MCRAGGRRCPGSGGKGGGRSATAGPAASTVSLAPDAPIVGGTPDRGKTPAASGGSVPTRADADRLAAQLPADRTGWDGKPLNDKDKRLYALRESGYKGPIDQDGYADTASEGAGTLRYMAEQRGETVDW
jgi:hypothetical protein